MEKINQITDLKEREAMIKIEKHLTNAEAFYEFKIDKGHVIGFELKFVHSDDRAFSISLDYAKKRSAYVHSLIKLILNFPQLQTLTLNGSIENAVGIVHDSYLEKIEALEGLLNLKELAINHFQIKKIEEISHLLQLIKLDLSDNAINKVENLEKHSKLETLNLSYNKIQKIEGLEGLSKLKELNLNGNQLSKIENLEDLSQLKTLRISVNPLSDEDKKICKKNINAIIKHCKKVKLDNLVEKLKMVKQKLNNKGQILEDYKKLKKEAEELTKKIENLIIE